MIFFLYLISGFGLSYGQSSGEISPMTNLEIIHSLIDSSFSSLPSDSFSGYEIIAPEEYSILQGRIKKNFAASGKASGAFLQYSLNSVKVRYADVFKDGIFGDFMVERRIEIKGSYVLTSGDKISSGDFTENYSDSLNYDKLSSVQFGSLPFTTNEIPEEPFFASLLEPAVAIGTAIVTVFLFFTVRSN